MAFFENFSKKAQDLAYAATEKGKDLAAVAGEKVQDAAESVKISAAIASEQRSMDQNYRAIGEWYVSEGDGAIPEAIADIVAAIRASQTKIADLEASRGAAKEEPAVQLKNCPKCGTATNSKFCPDCGAEIDAPAPAEAATAEDFADTEG